MREKIKGQAKNQTMKVEINSNILAIGIIANGVNVWLKYKNYF